MAMKLSSDIDPQFMRERRLGLKPGFKIICRHSAGNLHVNLYGEFNGMCAWELFKLLRQHIGSRRVFVNTIGIWQVAGEGVKLFRAYMTSRRMRRDWLYFKGNKGFSIAPDGSRVLVCDKARKLMEGRPHQPRQILSVVR
jgi:hypothetical protein